MDDSFFQSPRRIRASTTCDHTMTITRIRHLKTFIACVVTLACSYYYFYPHSRTLASATDAASSNHNTQKNLTFTTQEKSITPSFSYQATVKADVAETLASPYQGILHSIHKRYGDRVKAGDIVLTIESKELTKEFIKTSLDYLQSKKKQEKLTKKQNDNHTLYHEGIVAKNDFTQAEDELHEHTVKHIELQNNLHLLAKDTNISLASIENMTLDNPNDIKKLLNTHVYIPIRASKDGVLLSAEAITPDSKDASVIKGLIVGKPVGKDQAVAAIASPHQLALELNAPEQDLSIFKPHVRFQVQHHAQKSTLEATVHAVNPYQAIKNQDGSLGYPVVLHTPCATHNCTLHIGSQVTVHAQLAKQSGIGIPFTALSPKAPYTVKMIQKPHQTPREHAVTVLKTTPTEVIVQGLDVGQTIATYY